VQTIEWRDRKLEIFQNFDSENSEIGKKFEGDGLKIFADLKRRVR
jgi:hypothetical protein